MLDLGFPAGAVKAVPILARTAGLLAHLAEEREQPARLPDGGQGRGGGHVRAAPEDGAAVMLAPEVETRPWDEQLALDDAAYRAQLAYLFERSPFYREKLGRGRISTAARGRRARRHRAAAADREARAPGDRARRSNPIGAHLCAEPAEIVRIYSTSGTTGTPSYIPLTAGDLDNWVTGSARSYAASGVARRPAHRLDLQRRPVRRGRRARRVRPDRPLPHPGRHREHRAADARDRAARARGGGAHAVVRRVLDRVGGRARLRPARRRASSACSSPASRAAASPPSARGSRRAGARASPRRWASATSAPRSGASARSRTACTSARAASSTPS